MSQNPSKPLLRDLGVLLILVLFVSRAHSQVQPDPMVPVLKCTELGFCFCVRPAFEPAIATKVDFYRSFLAKANSDGKVRIYLSIPLSSGNGSNFDINREAAAFIAKAIAADYGSEYVAVLDPASSDADLPSISGKRASQGEYMFVWAQVLAGKDGLGKDIDAIYFTGPSDFERYFLAQVPGSESGRLQRLAKYFELRKNANPRFKKEIDDGKLTVSSFVSYYGIRASTAFSRGAHDEWNVAVAVNERRTHLATQFGISALLPMFYDGRAVEPSDLQSQVSSGNAANSCAQ